MCSLDLEPCSVWQETPRRARKERACDSCGSRISPGDAYLSISYVFDGSAGREGMCFACWWDWKRFSQEHGMSCMPSAFEEQLQDCIVTHESWSDEKPRPWAPELARLKARWRTSSWGRAALTEGWMRRAVRRELLATRRIRARRTAQ